MLFESKRIGVICGLTVVTYFLVLWMLHKELLWDFWAFNASWLPYFYLVYIGVKKYHIQNPETEFRFLVREGFIVYLIAQIIYYLFYYLLFFEIDPGLLELQKSIELEKVEETRGILGEQRADEMLRNLKEGAIGMTTGSLIRQFVPSLLPGFAMSAIFALIVKKSVD